MREDRPGDVRAGLVARDERHVGLGHGEPHRVRRRDDSRLGDGGVLDEDRLQLEGADLVVAGLEHVVGPADVGDVAVVVHGGDVARVVPAALHRRCVALRVALVAGHEGDGPLRQVEADLALDGAPSVGRRDEDVGQRVDDGDGNPGQGPAHRAGLDPRAGRVADGGGHLGLAEPVADRHPPRLLHLGDDLGVEGFTGTDDLAERAWTAGQVGVDEHPPHRRGGAQRGDLVGAQHAEQGGRVEPRVVVDEDRRLGDPRREERGPGVLGPAGARDVEVDVAGAQADPVHRREVADRVGALGVLDQLGLARRPGGEVEEQAVVGSGPRVRGRLRHEVVCR